MMPPPQAPAGAPEHRPGEQRTWQRDHIVFGLLLLAEVASNYLQLRGAQRQLVIAQQN